MSAKLELINEESLATIYEFKSQGRQFSALITDPPYSSGGVSLRDKAKSTSDKYQSPDAKKKHFDFIGDSRDQLSWMTWYHLWLSSAQSLLIPGAPVMLFSDWRQLGATINALQASGLTYQGIAVWVKSNARPVPDGFRQRSEFIVIGSNGPKWRGSTTKYHDNIIEASAPSAKVRVHSTQKPVKLMEQLIAAAPDGELPILDPFAGSGSTLVAAANMGVSCVGIEQSEEIYQLALQRLRDQGVA